MQRGKQQQRHQQAWDQRDRLDAEAIRQHASDHGENGADHADAQIGGHRRGLAVVEGRERIGCCVDEEILGNCRAGDQQDAQDDLAPVVPDDVGQNRRHAFMRVLLFQRLVEVAADVEPDRRDQDSQQERYAPAPGIRY